MVFLLDGVGLLVLALWVFCIIQVITTDPALCRNLPKFVWLLIVLILPDVGSIVWLVAGRPRGVRDPGPPDRGEAVREPGGDSGYGRSGAIPPDDDEAFLRSLRERAEEQRRKAREQRRAEEE